MVHATATTAPHCTATTPRPGFFTRMEMFLDARGKGAWIGAGILGFVVFWPLGLALFAYMLWRKPMFCKSHTDAHTHRSQRDTLRAAIRPSGNRAFDAYKLATLERLQNDQEEFDAFLQRLREAKDKAEFDSFMDERGAPATKSADQTTDEDDA